LTSQAPSGSTGAPLRLDTPGAAAVPPYLVWDDRIRAWRTEAINHLRLKEDAAAYHLDLHDQAEQFFDCPALHVNLPLLRPDQDAAIEAWERGGQRGVIVKPTGTGKTEIALAIIARHQVSALIVTPLRDLMYQWQRRIKQALGVEAGVLGDGRREVWPITVTTYDSAWIYMKEIGNRYRLIVYDEAHHLPGRTLHESALDCLAPMRLGLTATPERADGRDRIRGGARRLAASPGGDPVGGRRTPGGAGLCLCPRRRHGSRWRLSAIGRRNTWLRSS
jgi:hypothetical protein